MSHIDDWGMRDFWYRIGDIFARKTEAGGSLSWDGSNLSLNSVDGGTLDTEDLSDGLAKESEAAHTLSLSSSTLTLKAVNGATLATINLESIIRSLAASEVSSGTSGFMTQTAADGRYGRSLHYSPASKQLQLLDNGGHALSTVTLS